MAMTAFAWEALAGTDAVLDNDVHDGGDDWLGVDSFKRLKLNSPKKHNVEQAVIQTDGAQEDGDDAIEHADFEQCLDITLDHSYRFGNDTTSGFFFAVRFEDCVLNDAQFCNCMFVNVIFKDCTFDGTMWTNIFLQDVVFEKCEFDSEVWREDKLVEDFVTGSKFDEPLRVGDGMPEEIISADWVKDQQSSLTRAKIDQAHAKANRKEVLAYQAEMAGKRVAEVAAIEEWNNRSSRARHQAQSSSRSWNVKDEVERLRKEYPYVSMGGPSVKTNRRPGHIYFPVADPSNVEALQPKEDSAHKELPSTPSKAASDGIRKDSHTDIDEELATELQSDEDRHAEELKVELFTRFQADLRHDTPNEKAAAQAELVRLEREMRASFSDSDEDDDSDCGVPLPKPTERTLFGVASLSSPETEKD